MRCWLPLVALLLATPVAQQQTPFSRPPLGVPPEVNPRARPTPHPATAAVATGLRQDLEAAMALDAAARGITGQRDATWARDALVRSPIAGSPALGGSFRADTRGLDRAREWAPSCSWPDR